jgi:hypothetical protein
MSTTPPEVNSATPPPFRIDPQLHQILYKRPNRVTLEAHPEEVLPEPPYPQRPNATEIERRSSVEDMGRALFQIPVSNAPK